MAAVGVSPWPSPPPPAPHGERGPERVGSPWAEPLPSVFAVVVEARIFFWRYRRSWSREEEEEAPPAPPPMKMAPTGRVEMIKDAEEAGRRPSNVVTVVVADSKETRLLAFLPQLSSTETVR